MAQTKKTTPNKTTKSKKKNTKKKVSLAKGKVYIPPYKIIILCGGIIVVCMILLLLTTINPKQKSELQTSISERFEEYKNSTATAPAETKGLTAPYSKTQSNKNNSEATPATPKPQSKQNQETKSATTNKTSTTKQTAEVPAPAKPVEKPAEKSVVPLKPAPVQKTEQPKPAPVSQESKKITPTPAAPKQETPAKPVQTAQKKDYGFPQAKNNAQLIFVFDDGGQNMSHLEAFMNLPFPITVAVLPQIAHSADAAARVRKSGNEVILHQPMQSINSKVNPGPGAITPDMTEAQIRSTLWQNIDQISPIAGINNHEGSAITADAEKMETVLKTVSERSIYFLDSRTNVETKVPYVASELGYSYYQRDIFLDNEKTKENSLKELKRGLDIANKNGSVIMIGHIWSANYLPEFLMEVYPELKQKGYTFSTVSKSKAIRK